MFSKNVIAAAMGILSLVLLTSTNVLAISNDGNDVQGTNYTLGDGVVILHSLIGDINIPMPDDIKAELKRVENRQRNDDKFERLTLFGNRPEDNIHSATFADFFECNEQAQVALSVHNDNYRNWEAFFKRNSLSDTMAVRYCCNLLEYVDTAEMKLSSQCRERVRLQDHVMNSADVRYTCRQYEFHTVECFLVRWMYWWIPTLVILLIIIGIALICCAMKSRRSKEYLKARQDEKRFRTSLVNGSTV